MPGTKPVNVKTHLMVFQQGTGMLAGGRNCYLKLAVVIGATFSCRCMGQGRGVVGQGRTAARAAPRTSLVVLLIFVRKVLYQHGILVTTMFKGLNHGVEMTREDLVLS